MQRGKELQEGYHVFIEISQQDQGYQLACDGLARQINGARQRFDVEYIGGVQLKDAGAGGVDLFTAAQSCLLKLKPKIQEAKPMVSKK